MNTPPRPVKHFCIGEVKNVMAPLEGYEFFEEKTYHGDRDEIWICVYNKEGRLTTKWNCRFILGIEYA